MSQIDSKNAKPSVSKKSLPKIDDNKSDQNITFKITKKRSPWTQEVEYVNLGR
jgi:hypothetical protein